VRRAVTTSVFALSLLCLASCFDDQKQKVAACEAEAFRTYPSEQFDSIPVERYVRVCMRAGGYEVRVTRRCAFESNPGVSQAVDPYCYAPTGWFDQLTYRIELRGDSTVASRKQE
jgi:hypothetical protein